jgi:hypothetical protein
MSESTNPSQTSLMTPIFKQSGKLVSALFFFAIFAVIQWIRTDGPAMFGLLDYYRYDMSFVPNDYLLIISFSAISFIVSLILLIAVSFKREKVNPFVLGILGIFPAFGNLLTMLFLFYMLFYRGLWSLAELSNGFSFIPILKAVFFTAISVAGYKGFLHLIQLRGLLSKGEIEEYQAYVSQHNLEKG